MNKPSQGKANQRIPASWEIREKAFEKKMDQKLGRVRINGEVVRPTQFIVRYNTDCYMAGRIGTFSRDQATALKMDEQTANDALTHFRRFGYEAKKIAVG